jgi:hypothetical protein
MGSRDSAVRIATGYELDDKRGQSSSPARVNNFVFSTSSRPVLEPIQPRIQLVPKVPSAGVEGLRRGADYSRPTSAQLKKMWVHTTTHPYAFMAKCLIS